MPWIIDIGKIKLYLDIITKIAPLIMNIIGVISF